MTTTIENLQKQLKVIQSRKTKTKADEKKKADQLKEIDKQIAKQETLEQFKIGVYVVKVNNPLHIGSVSLVSEKKHSVECQVTWEPETVDQLRPSTVEAIDSSVLKVVDPELTVWYWDAERKRLTRKFDNIDCPYLLALFNEFKATKDEEKKEYLADQYNEIAKQVLLNDTATPFDLDGLTTFANSIYIGDEGLMIVEHEHCIDYVHELRMYSIAKEAMLDLSKEESPLKDQYEYIVVTLSELTLDSRLQQRVKYDQNAILDYQDCLGELPPIKAIKDDSGKLWVYDGYHTIKAHELAGVEKINVAVKEGTYTDAFKRSLSVNLGRGVRLTTKDRRKAVITAIEARDKGVLLDDKGKPLSNVGIAKLLEDVHRSTVDNIVKELKTGKTKHDERKEKEAQKKQQEKESQSASLPSTQETTKDVSNDPWNNGGEASRDEFYNEGSEMPRADVGDTAPVENSEVFERSDKPFEIGELVRIASTAHSKVLAGRRLQHAIVTDVNEFSVDLTLQGGKEAVGIAKGEVRHIGDEVKFTLSFDKPTAKQLIENFASLETALLAALQYKKQNGTKTN